MPKLRFIWNYRGHNSGMFERGTNWWQITLPPSRKSRRVALVVTWPTATQASA